MKIAHVIDYFQPELGYQETYLALEQIKTGHDVKVFTSDRYHPFSNYSATYKKILGKRIIGCGERIERGIKVLRLKVLLEINNQTLLRWLKEALLEFCPDIVICHGVISFSAAVISKINFSHKVKVIFDDHMKGVMAETFKHRLIRWFYLVFFKNSINKSAYKIIGVTKTTLEYLEKKLLFDKRKIIYLPLGFDPKVFYFSQQFRDEIRSRFNIFPSDIVGIYTGKIDKSKGIDELVDALKHLFGKYNNFRFIFVGNGDAKLLYRIKHEFSIKKVVIDDFMLHDQLCKYYSAADFGIWPAGITSSHVEALACKLPIIVSALSASAERVAYNNGISLRYCSKKEITQALEVLLTNKELREEYSCNSLKYAQNLSWKVINDKLLAL